MSIFSKKKKTEVNSLKETETMDEIKSSEVDKSSVEVKTKDKNSLRKKENVEEINIIEKPRICCLDLEEDVLSAMRKRGANIFQGTLGSKIKVPNKNIEEAYPIILNHVFPMNIQEYDIFIIDLNKYTTIEYNLKEHIKETHTGKSLVSLRCKYPETLFDPRPFASNLLRIELEKISKRKYLIIIFSSKGYDVDYEYIEMKDNYTSNQKILKYNIYSFWNSIRSYENRYGKEIKIGMKTNDLQILIEKHKKDMYYNQVFTLPGSYIKDEKVYDQGYYPLIFNGNDEIISYVETKNYRGVFLLPQIKDKASFLVEFLDSIAPSIYPELFPYSTAFKWIEQEEYWLPKHAELIMEKLSTQEEYEKKLTEIEYRIEDNLKNYSFLHEMLKETGDALVKAIIRYLKWLGFSSVHFMDESHQNSSILEEDIQIELENGLLIIECKGIGGTSTDADCNQIHKIKHRRSKERNKFDVFALYIVNHQRNLPPLRRQNPPFTNQQINDAKNDERGLLTTWQLFNLYFDIEKGIITKEEARNQLLEFGLIEFRPKDLIFVSKPERLYNNGEVCIININNISLKVNDELLIERNGKFEKTSILEIRDNNQPILQAEKGELSLRLDIKIRKNSILWKQDGLSKDII
jgi:hypothetical protein